MAVIPFYGATDPSMFAIERASMDRAGLVIERLDAMLPSGRVADIGAGDGFTADRLSEGRHVVAVEPSAGMLRSDRALTWVRADAEQLPFKRGVFDAAYSTWAYFFSRNWDPTPGLAELHRVVLTGGSVLIVDNAGDDEFTELAAGDISADPEFWRAQGFTMEVIETAFEFETIEEAKLLLGFFFGETGLRNTQLRVGFNVALFAGKSLGPGTLPR
ncbi:MAG: class I SAM-dependent methyltransferase [Acidimicrobiia bacterium]|nr:class I SAM-dependent methyltransferase [Acidimicrobiia bacterium]